MVTNRNINILLHGINISFINSCIELPSYRRIKFHKLDYFVREGIYYIDICRYKDKKKVIALLEEVCVSPNFYSKDSFNKSIILINFDKLRGIYQQSIKTIVDKSYLSCAFILHGINLNSIDKNIISRFLVLSLPIKIQSNVTTQLTMDKIVRLLKKPINKKVMKTIREICYMYYMDHKNSIDLQRLIIQRICSNYYLPNPIKYAIVDELSSINHLYQHSYRKPIFLEWIILCLFKHLQNYTTNLI